MGEFQLAPGIIPGYKYPVSELTFTVFAGRKRLVRGTLEEVVRKAKRKLDSDPELRLLIFDDQTSRELDFDFRGTEAEVLARAKPATKGQNEGLTKSGPGRPKLGVISREVSLLPRHWEWLEQQSQGISAALRRLIDEARKQAPNEERARLARASASRFMWVMAGDLAGFEEASRALFASDKLRFLALTKEWPKDVREHLNELLREGGAFASSD